jgi:hypothetical protein
VAPPDAPRLAAAAPFYVVVAYDEFAMGVRAKHLVEPIARLLKPDCELALNVWKFNMLRQPGLADNAVADAAAANMIILAFHEENRGVSEDISVWIEAWLVRRAAVAGALVLLIDPAPERPATVTPAHTYLHDVGRRGNLEVFALAGEECSDREECLCLECNRLRAAGKFLLPIHPAAKPVRAGT